MSNVRGDKITAGLFKTINKIGFFCAMPNLWAEELNYSARMKKNMRFYSMIMLVIITIFVCLECASYYTQLNLTEKQKGQLFMFSYAHVFYLTWLYITEYKKDNIIDLLYYLAVVLKEDYNDKEVEMAMVKKATKVSVGFSIEFMIALILYGYDGILQVVREGGTFTTVITCWPDVQERSVLADVARVANYLLWWAFMTRVCIIYVILISSMICLSHQYKHLQSYFNSLDMIFQNENLKQVDKEVKYEEAFKIGVKMHSQTLRCTKKSQAAYGVYFSVQVILGVSVLVMLMVQMTNSDRSLQNVLSIVSTAVFILISTAFLMWNAGDVSFEAAGIGTAMYNSGWHNCQHHSSRRVRRLMVIAMTQSQKPVTIWALGIVGLSYRSYVSMVRTSYSVFSVLY